MARSGRLIEYFVAAGLAVAAFVISPVGIKLFTGRADLSFRVNVISLTCDLFLIAVIAAVLAQGRLRRAFFYAIAVTFPFAVIAGVEAVALSIRLADRIAPLEDTSLLVHKDAWPAHLMSDARSYTDADGLRLYRPWQGDGITLNRLGLRTAPPTPKAPGEWRIAVTGGSAAWGWRVLDADTIPARLQVALRRAGHANVTVYNFGIEGATLNAELGLLKRFRDAYAIDQVLFYTGGNDATYAYVSATSGRSGPWAADAVTFELLKTAVRLQAMASEPAPSVMQWLDDDVLPAVLKTDALRENLLAADAYCRAAMLRCDFALQPMLFRRKTIAGPEVAMARTLGRVYPRLDVLTARLYRDALASGPAGHVHDLSRIFDQTSQPFFLDLIHLNEAGNRAVAEHLAPIVAPGLR